jgi:hypothetical protein
MTDTARTRSYMVGDGGGTTGTFANNNAGAIDADDMRDLIASMALNVETSYVIVQRGSTDIISGTALRTAYTKAKTLTPGGNAISNTNRVTVLVPPGKYDLVLTPLTLDTAGIDLVGMGGPDDVWITSQISTNGYGTVMQTTADVQIHNCTLHINHSGALSADYPAAYMPNSFNPISAAKGIINTNALRMNNGATYVYAWITNSGGWKIEFFSEVGMSTKIGEIDPVSTDKKLNITTTPSPLSGYCLIDYSSLATTSSPVTIQVKGLPVLKNVNLIGQNNGISTRLATTYGGTYINCNASNATSNPSFDKPVGTFTNCTTGTYGFGAGGAASGTFINCVASDHSFGSGYNATGLFQNCVSGDYSYGSGYYASGIFQNCRAGSYSFGGTDTGTGYATGIFTDCWAGQDSFNSGQGMFIRCVGGDDCFGGHASTDSASGVFIQCKGGGHSFGGGTGSTATGTFFECQLGTWHYGGGAFTRGVTTIRAGVFTGFMDQCDWISGGTLAVGTGARIYNSFISTGLSTATTATATISMCRLDSAIPGGITNDVAATAYNTII